jgi:hypothetical protein
MDVEIVTSSAGKALKKRTINFIIKLKNLMISVLS